MQSSSVWRRHLARAGGATLLLVGAWSCSGGAAGAAPEPGQQGSGPPASDLGRECASTTGQVRCGDGLECRDSDPIGGFVCTRSCNTDAECPSNGLCYIFDRDDGHI